MKLFFDTSILVEIDRNNQSVIKLLQALSKKGDELFISTVTVAEILTGSHLRKDSTLALAKAKEVLNQFTWIEINGGVAEIAAKLSSFLILEQKKADYPDILILACSLFINADALLTLNKKDFILFPNLKNKIYTPEEFQKTV